MFDPTRARQRWGSHLERFWEFGYVKIHKQFSTNLLSQMRKWIDCDLEDWKAYLDLARPKESGSLAHHVLVRQHWRDFLDELGPIDLFALLLGNLPIINTFGVNNNSSRLPTYAHSNHIDQKFTTTDLNPAMINLLVFIDDFTIENGATWIYPKDILNLGSVAPESNFGLQICGEAGDLLIWDSRMLHRAGENKTHQPRRAVSIMLSRPFVKPQFDYLSGLSDAEVGRLSRAQKQLLGYASRIPKTLQEWYLPGNERLYQPSQYEEFRR
jgi:hypothetical protein